MSTKAQRLKRYREDGVSFSRNSHYDFWARPENASVRQLQRYLQSIEREIAVFAAAGQIAVELEPGDGADRVHLVVSCPPMSTRHVAHLTREELALLAQSEGAGAVLKQHGVGQWLEAEASD